MNKKKLLSALLLMIVLISSTVFTSCSNDIPIPDEYNYDDFSEFIELGEYKGLTYEYSEPQVSRDEIKEYVDTILSESKDTRQIKSGTVKSDSVVNISYVGYVDGEEFEGGSSEGMDIDISDNNFIEGFAEGLIGRSVGETFDLNVTFPSDYFEDDLAGKPAVFKTTINYIQEEVAPDYNDEFVQSVSDCKTVAEYEEYVKGILLDQKKSEQVEREHAEIFNQIIESSVVIKYPEKEYNNRYDSIVNTYKIGAEESGVSFEEYIMESLGIGVDEFYEQAKASAQNTVKTELVVHAIAALEGIEVTKSDYNDYLNQLLEDAGTTREDFEQSSQMTLEMYASQNNLYSSLMYQRVIDKVMEYSNAK